MPGTSDYLANKLADWELRGQAFTPPATVYVALLICSKGPLARSTAYASGDTVSYVAADGANHLYKCTTAGTTAASAPSYPGNPGEAITDGTAVFTEQSDALAAGTAEVEPSGGSYARVAVACSLANWSGTQGAGTTTASSGSTAAISNNNAITFTTPTANWESAGAEIWGFATYDAATSGNLLRWGGLTADQIINTGNSVSFAAAALALHFDKR